MARKTIIIADPGIDGAFAIALALSDPEIEVLALIATAGNVSHQQATANMHTLLQMLDPPRFPRLGAALPLDYERTATDLHGSDGLGGLGFPSVELHHPHPADRVLLEQVRAHPGEVSVLVLGPATVLARALDRDPESAQLMHRVIMVGGTWHETGDASPVAEYHFWCDPRAAQQVISCGAPITLLPLDVTRKLVYSPADLRLLPPEDTKPGAFLRKVMPPTLSRTAGIYGTEGVHLNDVVAVVALTRPEVVSVRPMPAAVETTGDLTRGMSVFDARWATAARPNIDLATGLDVAQARGYIHRTMGTGFA